MYSERSQNHFKSPKIYLLQGSEEEEDGQDEHNHPAAKKERLETQEAVERLEISLNAITSTPTPNTM